MNRSVPGGSGGKQIRGSGPTQRWAARPARILLYQVRRAVLPGASVNKNPSIEKVKNTSNNDVPEDDPSSREHDQKEKRHRKTAHTLQTHAVVHDIDPFIPNHDLGMRAASKVRWGSHMQGAVWTAEPQIVRSKSRGHVDELKTIVRDGGTDAGEWGVYYMLLLW